MCGRYTLTIRRQRFEAVYGVQAPLDFMPRYNIAPTQNAPIIRQEAGELNASLVRWGFRTQHSSAPIINARAETIHEKTLFRLSLQDRRCLIPASGWYEWRVIDGKKQPYYLSADEQSELAFAGIWTARENTEQFAIITTAANESLEHVHNRMPVILPRERWQVWLADTPLEEVLTMLEPYPARDTDAWMVGARVGNVRNEGEDLLEPLF
jgi:putative SOS response-associated peptidase YedK